MDLKEATSQGLIIPFDRKADYLGCLQEMSPTHNSKIKVVVDPMYGVASGYMSELLRELGHDVIEIRNEVNPCLR